MHPSDHPIISERYFFPRVAPPPWPARIDVEVDDATLACAQNREGHPLCLLHFHGNGEVVDDYLPDFAKLVSKMGLDSFFAEYRGYGGSTGTPLLGTMLDDVDALVAAAGDVSNLVVFGRSIGSIYAIEVARRYPKIRGLVLESGIANVLERILLRASPSELGTSAADLQSAFAQRFDHHAKLRAYPGPVLILHAQHDHLVSVEHAKENAASAGKRCHLEILPRGDHNSIFFENQDRYLEALRSFVAAL